MTTVIKRDGTREGFNPMAIENAIVGAMSDVGNVDLAAAQRITTEVTDKYRGIAEAPIRDIQDLVEHKMMCSSHKAAAKAYIEYRRERDMAREMKSDMVANIQGLMGGTDEALMTENANKDSTTIPTKRDLLAGIISKHYALNHVLPKEIADAHSSGDIHYHDLDYSPFGSYYNCMLIDLKGMLTSGFRLGNAELESPKSIGTATAVTAQIIAQVASHIYGGNTINGIDEILAPYVKMSYDKHLAVAAEWLSAGADHDEYAMARTEKECYDAFQALEYEINTLHTANGQTPFCTFGFGLGTCEWSRMIQMSILQVRINGLGKNGHTAVFPKLVMGIKDGVNHKPGDPNYLVKQRALECASKRMYPDILNYDQLVEVTGGFKYPMGCRSFLHEIESGVHDGRMNLGVVSLNLPRIAIEADGKLSEFVRILDQRLDTCGRALKTRIDRLATVRAQEAPILYIEGATGLRLDPEELVLPHLKELASISLGYIGLNETVNALFPDDKDHMYDSPTKQGIGLEIVRQMKAKVDLWKEQSGFAFSLYSTPSESLCRRFLALDRDAFGVLPGVTDKEYYTNSFHLDVQKNVNPYDKIDFERPFITLATGGFISYGEFPNMKHNLKALEDVWDYAYYNTPYYGTNTPVDSCFDCGFEGEFLASAKGFECPKCGNHGKNKNVIRRVCGYLGEADDRPFNKGKMQEVEYRVKHL